MTAWLAAVCRRSCRRSLPRLASAHAVRQQFARTQMLRPSAWRGNRNASGLWGPGNASMSARAASPSGTARGPVFESARLMASSPMSRQRRFSTSLRRHPVSASSRTAATASGQRASSASSTRPSRASAVRRTGLVPARRVEPRGHVLGADAVERHFTERRQDAGLEIDAHGPAPGGLPVRFAAPQILVRELPQGRGLYPCRCRRRGSPPRGCARGYRRRGGGPRQAPFRPGLFKSPFSVWPAGR